MITKHSFIPIYMQSFARRVFTMCSQSAFLQQFLYNSYRYFVLYFPSSFQYTIYRGSGLTFIVTLQFLLFFFFSFGDVCQQRDLPLFVAAAAVKCGSFFYFWGEWECDRGLPLLEVTE